MKSFAKSFYSFHVQVIRRFIKNEEIWAVKRIESYKQKFKKNKVAPLFYSKRNISIVSIVLVKNEDYL